MLRPVHIGWLFTAVASETSAVLGWIWGIHLCITSEFLLHFMNCLSLYVIWISSIAYLFHFPHMEVEGSGAYMSGVEDYQD